MGNFKTLLGRRRVWLLIAAVFLSSGYWLVRANQKRIAALPLPTPHTDRAAAFVRVEAESWGESCGVAMEYRYALAAMNHIHTQVSPGVFSSLSQKQQLPTPLNAEKCLALQAGICGNHVDVFDRLLARLPLPVKRRSAEFYLHDEKNDGNCSHVVGEIYYKGGWRMFDITAGTVFLRRDAKSQDDLLSAQEIRDLVRRGEPWRDLAVCNNASVRSRQYTRARTDPYRYLEWPDTDLILGRAGTIHLRADASGTKYSLDNVPTLLGHFEDYCGNIGDLQFSLDVEVLRAAKQRLLRVTILDIARSKGNVDFVVGSTKRIYHRERLSAIACDRVVDVDVSGSVDAVTVQIESATGFGSASIGGIEVR